ncbi:dihydrolipoamide acetyltransferase family protein [Patulibacter sp. NPDC049589]|uniref:dihydrolipoamide acetyltransferase family protein n=1 Tax=Patulibacter sp. NPDC049589 TaxID=3154731 RepID=UPI00341FD257
MSSSRTEPLAAPDAADAPGVTGHPAPSGASLAGTDRAGAIVDAEGTAPGGEVLMPRMGTSVAEGTIVAWKVAVGDVVVRDQVLCEVSTDKVDVECPAFEDGVIEELVVEEGETVDVGTVIARLRTTGPVGGATPDGGTRPNGATPAGTTTSDATAGGGTAAATSAAGTSAAAAEGAVGSDGAGAPTLRDPTVRGGATVGVPADPRSDRRDALRRSSPVAARLADEHGVDVRALNGSGRNGRVTKRDVLAAAEAGATTPPPAAGDAPAEAPMHSDSPYRHDPSIPVAGATQGSSAPPVVPADLGGTPVPASRMRRSIGDAVRRSLDAAAHCTTIVECDMSRVERERRVVGLTALPLLARAAIETLQAFPALNATFDGETVTRYGERVHLGIAVSLGEDGLIAPVIHDAQDLSVQGLARRIKDLAARARAGRLSPDEVRGGTFTITNPGAAGALMATPVINLPQVAILDLEAIVRRPVVVADADGNESIGIRPMVHLCMGWDHRALDGLYAAQFLTALRRRVEG